MGSLKCVCLTAGRPFPTRGTQVSHCALRHCVFPLSIVASASWGMFQRSVSCHSVSSVFVRVFFLSAFSADCISFSQFLVVSAGVEEGSDRTVSLRFLFR